MKFTLITPDRTITIDGVAVEIGDWDALDIHPAVNVVQYDEATGRGEIEWVAPVRGRVLPNVKINRDQFGSMFQHCVELWEIWKGKKEAQIGERRAKVAAENAEREAKRKEQEARREADIVRRAAEAAARAVQEAQKNAG